MNKCTNQILKYHPKVGEKLTFYSELDCYNLFFSYIYSQPHLSKEKSEILHYRQKLSSQIISLEIHSNKNQYFSGSNSQDPYFQLGMRRYAGFLTANPSSRRSDVIHQAEGRTHSYKLRQSPSPGNQQFFSKSTNLEKQLRKT